MSIVKKFEATRQVFVLYRAPMTALEIIRVVKFSQSVGLLKIQINKTEWIFTDLRLGNGPNVKYCSRNQNNSMVITRTTETQYYSWLWIFINESHDNNGMNEGYNLYPAKEKMTKWKKLGHKFLYASLWFTLDIHILFANHFVALDTLFGKKKYFCSFINISIIHNNRVPASEKDRCTAATIPIFPARVNITFGEQVHDSGSDDHSKKS